MEKKYLLRFLIFVLVTLMSFSFTSCEKEEEEEPDPSGTIELDIRKDGQGGTYLYFGENHYLYINKSDNFKGYRCKITDVGSVKGLASIKSIPLDGWADEVGVRPGHGYVIGGNNEITYMRLYVVEYIKGASDGGVIGVAVKYQYPWHP